MLKEVGSIDFPEKKGGNDRIKEQSTGKTMTGSNW